VNRPRDELLACPGLTEDHHRGIGRGHFAHRLQHIEHAAVRSDDPADVVVLLDLLAQPVHLVGEFPVVERLVDGELELLEIEGLGQVLTRARLHRFDRGGDVAVGREHDDGERGALTPQAPQHLHPVGCGHPVVEHHDVGFLLSDRRERLLAVRSLDDLEAFPR